MADNQLEKLEGKSFDFAHQFTCTVRGGVVEIEEYNEGEFPLEHIKTIDDYKNLYEVLTGKQYEDQSGSLVNNDPETEFVKESFVGQLKVVNSSLFSYETYWKRRCELAENYIDKSPCDPDITNEQMEARSNWEEFKKTNPQ